MAHLDIFRETTQQAILNELKAQSALVSILAHGYDIDSPAALQALCASGQIGKWLHIGDVIFIPWTDTTGNTPVEYSFPFVVTYIGDVYDAHGEKHENGLWLMAMYAEPQEIPFDASEDTVVDLSTEPNALEGWYYWGLTGSDYTELKLSPGDAIPTSYGSIHKCAVNNLSALRYGYNRWSMSAYRQWLNSDAEKGAGWWTPQHMGDVAPGTTHLNKPGWLAGFTAEWRAIFKPVRVETACTTVTDGGVTDTTGLPEPSNGSSSAPNDARKIPSIANPTGAAVYVRLRSACRGYLYVWYVTTGGYLNYSNANTAYRAQPACVIY